MADRHQPVPPVVVPGGGLEVLATLRAIADSEGERMVRASALIALGRMGGEEDARRFVETLLRESEPIDVREAAAVGLGILPPFENVEVTQKVRLALVHVLKNPAVLPGRTRGLVILTIGLRARDDAGLRLELAARIAEGGLTDAEEASNLLFACGLSGDAASAPDLLRDVPNRRGEGANGRKDDAALAVNQADLRLGPRPRAVDRHEAGKRGVEFHQLERQVAQLIMATEKLRHQDRRAAFDRDAQTIAAGTAEPLPEVAATERETRLAIKAAIADLDPVEQQVIVLAYDDGLTQSEIAASLGWPIGTVKTRTRRALRHLREQMTPGAPPPVAIRTPCLAPCP